MTQYYNMGGTPSVVLAAEARRRARSQAYYIENLGFGFSPDEAHTLAEETMRKEAIAARDVLLHLPTMENR